jgi:PAS domain S-box-containing protein
MDTPSQDLAQQSLEFAIQELKRLTQQFRMAIDTIPGLVWSSQPDGHIDFLNERWREYTGLSLAQASGWGWRAAIHPQDLPGLESYWRSLLASGQPGETEARLRRFDGVYRWFLFRGVPLHDESGKVVKWYGQNIDIDDRKCAEEQLRRSEAYLREAQRLSRTGSFGWRPATGELVWSDETFCILGYDRTVQPDLELVLNRIHPDDIAVVRDTLERATREGQDLDLRHRLRMPDGSVKHLHIVARAGTDTAGGLEYVGAAMDVTERERTAAALRASEHLARGQLDALTQTLNALAQESDPDKLLEHVLRTIVAQAGAHSVSVWGRSDDGDWLDLIALLEGDRFQSRHELVHPATRLADHAPGNPVHREILRTGQHAVLEDIDQPSARMRLGSAPEAAWHPVLEDADPDPAMLVLKQHLRGLGVRAMLLVPMMIAGRAAGIIGIRFTEKRDFRPEDIQLTSALAHQAMLAIQSTRLSRQSSQAAVVAERNRMARDIHDTLAQGFTGVIVQLEAAADARSKGLGQEADEHLARAGELARESLREARRSVHALRPQTLEEKNLCEALEQLIGKLTLGTTIRAELSVEGPPRALPPAWEENLLRIGQEALTNALRHSRASHIAVQLSFAPEELRLGLRDDGQGFDPLRKHEGFGLQGIAERVEEMGGRLTIESAPGEGTQIRIVVPTANIAPAGE